MRSPSLAGGGGGSAASKMAPLPRWRRFQNDGRLVEAGVSGDPGDFYGGAETGFRDTGTFIDGRSSAFTLLLSPRPLAVGALESFRGHFDPIASRGLFFSARVAFSGPWDLSRNRSGGGFGGNVFFREISATLVETADPPPPSRFPAG